MDSPFPNSSEQIVASSLLLLSSSSSSEETTGNYDADRSESLMLSKSFSRSSASSTVTVSSDDVSSDEAHGRAIARFQREIQLKVVRKSRSKTLWISDSRKLASVEQKSIVASGSSSLTTEGSSSVSVGSSSLVSSSEISKPKPKRGRPFAKDSKKNKLIYAYNSANLLRRSEAILNVLAHNGCVSEIRIRQLLGDSPDTSKALRILLKKDEVKRSGAGGRTDPFIYQIAA